MMRIAQPISLAGLVALQVALVSGCVSPVAPTVTRPPMTSLKANPTIFLQATVQRPRIIDSLRNSRLRPATSYAEADYVLNVVVGKRRVKMECGGTHNVIYTLEGNGRQLMGIKGRGLTGSCIPNIFDDMSEMLASYFGN
jgi:hypothetical protein